MATVPDSASDAPLVFDRAAQIRTAIVGLAFIAVYYLVIVTLTHKWRSADWSHGWLIPWFSAYLVYLHWDQVRRSPVRHTWVGLALMIVSLVAYQCSLWLVMIGYLQPLSMLLCLLGVVIYLRGLPIVKHIWVPWLYLFFAVPLPQGVYFAITDPLRQIAATIATSVMNLFPALTIERVGSTISYIYKGKVGALDVADACSGMRSTMTLCALGVAVTFISDRPWWQRILMVGSCVPIAVLANAIRVTITCVLHVFVNAKYAGGTYHAVLGLVMLLIAFGIFSGLGWVLNNLFVEEPDSDATAA